MQTFFDVVNVMVNSYEAQAIFRVLLAVCFGALIGVEREHAHRPAGLRTHILVCVGACLIMLTAEYVYKEYHQFSPNMDVTRLGAQVISGIGFLGAGTIIRNGSSVKGLTTAASIWVVGCIGLATGIGYYLGATFATIVIFLCLAYIKRFLSIYDHKKILLAVTSKSTEIKNIVDAVQTKLSDTTINLDDFSIRKKKDNISEAHFKLSMNTSVNHTSLVNEIYSLPGVISININSHKNNREEE